GFDARLKQIEKDRAAANRDIKDAEKIDDEAKRKSRIAELNKRLDALKADQKKTQDDKEKVLKRPLPFETAYAVTELRSGGKKKIGNARVQIKGAPEHRGKEVPRHFPAVLGGQSLPASEKGSGRLELANWLTAPATPLFARVMVSRLWHFHF